MFRELEEINLRFAGHRLSWDDTPEGERLRRYGLTCKRAWSRMFDLLLKIRSTAGRAGYRHGRVNPSLRSDRHHRRDRSVGAVRCGRHDPPRRARLEPVPPIEEPVPPNEANLAPENAPNEPNSHVQATSPEHRDAAKEVRIDTPHVERKAGGRGITGKADEPSRVRAGDAGPEDADEPVADLRRAVKASAWSTGCVKNYLGWKRTAMRNIWHEHRWFSLARVVRRLHRLRHPDLRLGPWCACPSPG